MGRDKRRDDENSQGADSQNGEKDRDLQEYLKILEVSDESEDTEGEPSRQDEEKSDELYLKSLKEKIEKMDTDKAEAEETAKFKFISYPPSEEKSDESIKEEKETSQQIQFQMSERTTQKLEEEMRGQQAQPQPPPQIPLPSTGRKFKGNSIYVLCGPEAGKSFYIGKDRIFIGRSASNDVVLRDISVSRKHCVIYRRGGEKEGKEEGEQWFIEDLGSDNGTFINGKLVTKSRLNQGQYIQLGKTIIILESC